VVLAFGPTFLHCLTFDHIGVFTESYTRTHILIFFNLNLVLVKMFLPFFTTFSLTLQLGGHMEINVPRPKILRITYHT